MLAPYQVLPERANLVPVVHHTPASRQELPERASLVPVVHPAPVSRQVLPAGASLVPVLHPGVTGQPLRSSNMYSLLMMLYPPPPLLSVTPLAARYEVVPSGHPNLVETVRQILIAMGAQRSGR